MFRHLLVPVDDTSLSTANVSSAIELARAEGARITFFYATPDWSATGDGAILLAVDQDLFAKGAIGETHALLAKAMAAAQAARVPCHADSCISDHPAQAIVQAAQDHGCDLIVMASRGRPAGAWQAWRHASQTERVLRHSPVALLVTRVGAEHPLTNSERALAIIGDEHRSIAAVLGAMREIANDLAPSAPQRDADIASLAGMVSYLREFPQRLHHPKEDEFLHPRMCARDPACRSLLADIEAQHQVEFQLIDRVDTCLADAEGVNGVQALREAVLQYVEHVRQHLALEEAKVLPLARRCLGEDDWDVIAQAFSEHRFDLPSSTDLRQLFTHIANGMAARAARQAQGAVPSPARG